MLRHKISTICLILLAALCCVTAFGQHTGQNEVTLTRCWQYPGVSAIGLATDGQDIFSVLDNGRVVALSGNGDKLWETELGGTLGAGITTAAGLVIVRMPSGPTTILKPLSAATGIPVETPAPAETISRPPNVPVAATASASIDGAFAYGDAVGYVTAVGPGGSIWKFRTGGSISSIAPYKDEVIIVSRDNFIYSLNSRNGGLNWKKRLQGRIQTFTLGEKLLIASALDQHGASVIDLDSGRLVGQISLGPEDEILADPVGIKDRFFFATSNGIVAYSAGECSAK
jgi:hypothetical protein